MNDHSKALKGRHMANEGRSPSLLQYIPMAEAHRRNYGNEVSSFQP
jgi:hypothetical protein